MDEGISKGLGWVGPAGGLSPAAPVGSRPSCPGSWGRKATLRILLVCPSSSHCKRTPGTTSVCGGQPCPPTKNTEHQSCSTPWAVCSGPANILSKQGAGGGGRSSPRRCSIFCSISEATILPGSDVQERGLSRGVMTSRSDCSGHPLPVIKGG